MASKLDATTERMINYLSPYSVPINAIEFHYFQKDNEAYLVRVFLIEPEIAEQRVSRSRGPTRLTEGELLNIAQDQGVENLYSRLVSGLMTLFQFYGTTKSSIYFGATIEKVDKTILSIIPEDSDATRV